MKRAARLHCIPAFAFGGLRVVGVRPDRSNLSALRAHLFVGPRCRGQRAGNLHEEKAPLAPWFAAAGIHPTLCRHARSAVATLPRRTVPYPLRPLGVEPFGICRMHSSPGLVGDQPSRAARGPFGAEWRGQGAKACPIAPPDYRTRPDLRLLPEVAGFSRPTPMPTARGPHSKETARGRRLCVRVPSGRQPIIDLSRYSSILMGGGIGVGRLARQVRGNKSTTQGFASSIEKLRGTYRMYRLMYGYSGFLTHRSYRTCPKSLRLWTCSDREVRLGFFRRAQRLASSSEDFVYPAWG